MEQEQLYEREARCIQENPPACTAGCPVHVDVRGMLAAILKGDYSAGFGIFNKSVPFPGIISRICDHPCQQVCKRNEIDESIYINFLERSCVDNNVKSIPSILSHPVNNKKVAVVGAGLSGLTAAIDLARKGYTITIYEAKDRPGGSIYNVHDSKLPEEIIEKDFSVFSGLPVTFNYNAILGGSESSISPDRLCSDFDAFYLAIGNGAPDSSIREFYQTTEGLISIDPVSLATSHPKIFAGGSLRREGGSYSPIASVSDGRIAAISIDRLCQNVSLTANRGKEGAFTTSLYTNTSGITVQPATPVSDPDAGYSSEEAAREAGRCIFCECLECVKECEYLAHYGSYPKKYVREIYNNLSIVKGFRKSNKMINSCSLCGLCGELCPNDLNMAEICHEARQTMVKKGKMPPSAHEFALRDMQFSNSDQFLLSRHQPGFTSSKTIFFPGCQLSASTPQYIKPVYDYLCDRIEGGVGLMLGCCGAPADWAGRDDLTDKTVQNFQKNYSDMGASKLVTACPSCFGIFHRLFPEMQIDILWTLFDRIGLPDEPGAGLKQRTLAVHDSCTTRYETQLHESIRNIISKLGHTIEELPRSRERTICCGYGGLMIFANREVAYKEINRRIGESQSEYISYCSMCMDNFASQGKTSYHILDLIFGNEQDCSEYKVPGYSKRLENRARLKRSLLREIWGEDMDEPRIDIKLIIDDDVRSIMEHRMILDSDLIKVIGHAESTGNKFLNTGNDHYIACFKPANVTYWVEYSVTDNGFIIYNTYCHRLNVT